MTKDTKADIIWRKRLKYLPEYYLYMNKKGLWELPERNKNFKSFNTIK